MTAPFVMWPRGATIAAACLVCVGQLSCTRDNESEPYIDISFSEISTEQVAYSKTEIVFFSYRANFSKGYLPQLCWKLGLNDKPGGLSMNVEQSEACVSGGRGQVKSEFSTHVLTDLIIREPMFADLYDGNPGKLLVLQNWNYRLAHKAELPIMTFDLNNDTIVYLYIVMLKISEPYINL